MQLDNPNSWFSAEFWVGILQRTVTWAVQALPKVAIVLALAFVLLKLLRFGCGRLEQRAARGGDDTGAASAIEHRKRSGTLIAIVRKAGVVTIWSFIVMLVLMQVGVDIAPLIAGAGIVGLAVGFGAQELVRDVITGFFILLEDQIRTGDVAIINGVGGLVESISLRTIALRDLSGTVHTFQNGKISSLSNMTKGWSAMVFDVGVAYKEDTDEVSRVMKSVADELQQDTAYAAKILEPIEIFGVDEFGDSAVVIKARIKTLPIEQWNIGREYRRRLKKAFDARNIEIPFPHQTLYWGDASPPFEVKVLADSSQRETNGQGTGERPQHIQTA